MKNENFEHIIDAYQLAKGSIIKEKDQDELFEVGEYDADKKSYTAYPFEDGQRFDDFNVLISESELMDNYLIETKRTIMNLMKISCCRIVCNCLNL